MNHLRSVHPARVLRIRKEESVPDDADEDGVNNACSGLPHIYWNKKETFNSYIFDSIYRITFLEKNDSHRNESLPYLFSFLS